MYSIKAELVESMKTKVVYMDVEASHRVFINELEIWLERTRKSLIFGTVGPRNRTKLPMIHLGLRRLWLNQWLSLLIKHFHDFL